VRVRNRRNGEERILRSAASPVLMDGHVVAAVAVNTDITDRKLAEAARHESEESQAYLLKLSDALRPLADPGEIKVTATRLIGAHLGVNRAFYADAKDDRWLVAKGYERAVEPLPDVPFAMADYGNWIIADFRSGKRVVVTDMNADARFQAAERLAHLSLQI